MNKFLALLPALLAARIFAAHEEVGGQNTPPAIHNGEAVSFERLQTAGFHAVLDPEREKLFGVLKTLDKSARALQTLGVSDQVFAGLETSAKAALREAIDVGVRNVRAIYGTFSLTPQEAQDFNGIEISRTAFLQQLEREAKQRSCLLFDTGESILDEIYKEKAGKTPGEFIAEQLEALRKEHQKSFADVVGQIVEKTTLVE